MLNTFYKIIPLTLFCIFFTTSSLHSQITVGTRLGLNSITGINIEVTAPMDKNLHYYTGISYFYQGYSVAGPGCGILWPSPLIDPQNKGFALKFGMTFTKIKNKRGIEKTRHSTISLLYRRFEGTFRQNESGCGEFWLNYDFTANDIGFYLLKDYNMNKPVNFYWGFGLVNRVKTQKTIPSSIIPSSDETTNQMRFLLDLGFRIRLFKIQK